MFSIRTDQKFEIKFENLLPQEAENCKIELLKEFPFMDIRIDEFKPRSIFQPYSELRVVVSVQNCTPIYNKICDFFNIY